MRGSATAKATVMPERASWGDGEVAAVRDLARTFFEKEVVPQRDTFVVQGHPDCNLYRRAGELGLL
jgi:acyl-CoA dehydrogenase